MDSYRTFIAIELPVDLRSRILEHIANLRHELPDVRARWSRQDNLHLTLKFMGDVSVVRIPPLSQAVGRATLRIAPFEITVSGCGTFPPNGRPNILWIGTDAANLFELHTAIEREGAAVGFPPEPRPFHPHLTIARLRNAQGARQLAELHKRLGFPPQSFTVSEVVVFRSELMPEGSRHSMLSRHRLKQ